MIGRQKILLGLVHRAGGEVSRLNLVKWAFLFAQESKLKELRTFYQFLPYRFGPFSFTLYHELDNLIRDGELIAPSKHELTLPAFTRRHAPDLGPELRQEIEIIWLRYGDLPTTQLVDMVYARYPWYTLNSDSRERRAVQLPKVEHAVYTAGYEGMQIDEFLNLLLRSGIRRLVDVRHNPVSRKYGFHKTTLSHLCQRLGIEYCHKPEVGIAPKWRTALGSASDYERLFARYEAETLPEQKQTVAEIAALMATGPSVLVCQEADPAFCHRQRLAKQVAGVSGLVVRDLRSL